MQIVIDMLKDTFEKIREFDGEHDVLIDRGKLYEAIQNGTPLPKGHGDLIEADALALQIAELSGDIFNPCYGITYSDIKNAPIIIKADRESEVTNETDN